MRSFFGFILSVLAVFLLIVVVSFIITLPLSGFHQPIERGTYTGQVIDYTHQRGLIFKTNDLTTKTHERSSQRENWCVPDNKPELVEKVRSIDEGEKVDIVYYAPLWMWIDTCGSPNKVIKEIEVVPE